MSSSSSRPSSGAWVAAGIVIVICLLSTFTFSDDGDSAADAAAGPAAGDSGYGGVVEGPDVVGRGPKGGKGGAAASGGGRGSSNGRDGASGGSLAGASNQAGGPAAGGGPIVADPNVDARTGKVYDCKRGQNAGATDTGVDDNEIRFAATVVKEGIAADFLRDAQYGMEAVIRKVNQEGGICGRLIKVTYDNDSWDPADGSRIIEKYISEKKYFGLAVNPSSEGLRYPIENGTIRNNQFPVVGADGMLIGQYEDPWVWPVATSTHSVMHIMAKDAYARGARKFAIVWESNYRFGVEGHNAFKGTIERLAKAHPGQGIEIVADREIRGGDQSYSNQANDFVGKCSTSAKKLDKCHFIAMLLEPNTASTWVEGGGLGTGEPDKRPKPGGIGAPQPLFVTSFARNCQRFCANMRVWTGFKPPIEPFVSEPAVAAYKSALANVSGSADPSNPHVEGAYVGMQLLVQALERLGPAPTRAGLKAVLDQTTLQTGLSPALSFAPGNHFAATSAQSFEAIYISDSFNSWRYTGSGFKTDSEVTKDR